MQNDLNSNKNVIEFRGVQKTFGKEEVLKDVYFRVGEGEFACLVGSSGSGKSTILRIIAGLEEPTEGEVVHPQNISLVFQNGALLPWFTVFENVALGLRARKANEAKTKETVDQFLKMVGLELFAQKYPHELSGGQRQRVGIARALAVDPKVLLLDEPFSALDVKTTEDLHNDLLKIWQATGKTIVMVSHSIEEAVVLADVIYLVQNGRIEETFKIEEKRPRREEERSFIHEILTIRKKMLS